VVGANWNTRGAGGTPTNPLGFEVPEWRCDGQKGEDLPRGTGDGGLPPYYDGRRRDGNSPRWLRRQWLWDAQGIKAKLST